MFDLPCPQLAASSDPQRVRAGRLRLALCGALLLATACVPTISKQRGETHLNALAEAEAHHHHGRYEQAVASYEKAATTAERRVDRDEARYRESRVYARMGNYDKAIELCDALGSEEPIARRTLRARLDAARYRLRAEKEVERAESDLEALIVQHPEDAAADGALRLLAPRHVDQVETGEQALAWVEDLLSRVQGTGIAELLMNIQGELLLDLQRRDEAISVFEGQVERFPYPKGRRWDDTLYRLADLALEDKQPKKAIAYLEKMIAVHESSFIIGSYTRPMFSKAALRIARIYRDELHDTKSAIAAYQHVRDEFPRSLSVDDALEEEAELRIAQGQRDKGCELLAKVIETHETGSARKRAEARRSESCH